MPVSNQRFKVECEGHECEVTLSINTDAAFFNGSIVSEEFGMGHIEGQVMGLLPLALKGDVLLEGYNAHFQATIDLNSKPAEIKGSINYGWFFHKDFSGQQV